MKTNSPLIIALTGKPGNGKDTVAGMLVQLGFTGVAFADLLRHEVAEAWRIDPRMLSDRTTKEWKLPVFKFGMCTDPEFLKWSAHMAQTEDRSARQIMQVWGDYRRSQDPNYFVTPVGEWIGRNHGTGWNRMVITDLRFENEAAMLKRMGAKVVRLHRPGLTNVLQADTANHISEQHASIAADYDLVNDGGLDALAQATLEMVAKLLNLPMATEADYA